MAPGSRQDEDEQDSHAGMLIAFWGYLTVIVAGLGYFIVIGLTHR